ncbi:MAG: LPD38 domain-containing protein [Muribaculaceae bacterium]|nr:LPD38 domain-containing protein [Muribaculaceae bacterium]
MSEKSRQFLHGEFVKAGLNVGTAEEFDSLMVNNAESRNWAKAQAERLGFDTTDFDRKMTDVTITPTNENVAVSDTTKPTDTPAQILARTKEKATSNNGGRLMAMPVANLDQWKQEADIKARQAVEDGKATPVMYADNPDLTEAELKQSASPYAQGFAKKAERMLGVGNKAFAGNYYEETDPLTGKESYYDVLGNEHMTPLSATQFSNDYIKPIHNQMNAKRDYINSLDQRIADTENKIKEVQAEQAKKTSNANKGASAFMPASARAITETQTAEQLAPQETEELKQLHATLKDLHDMKTTVQAQNELTKSDGFFDWNNAKNIWRGLSDTYTDPYFYSSFLSFGATDLTDAQTKAKVFDKIEKGQELTDTEMQLALASGMADDIKSSADLPIGYGAGEIGGKSLAYISQFLLNPASGLAKTAAKAAVRKVGRSGLKAVTARVGVRALGATAEGAVLANTIQAGATAADIIDRKTGKVKLGFDENGYLIPTEIDDKKSWGQAIYEGEASKIIEAVTELMGLPGVGKLTKAGAKGLEKLGLKNVRKTINTLSRSKMSQFLERAGWHGPLGEFGEEQGGMFLNIIAQTGDNQWSDFLDTKKQSEILLGCSLFGGTVSVYTTTSAATSLALDAKAERRIKSTDAIAKGRLTEARWLPIKEEFDNALDSEREAMVGRIMSDTSLQPQEKKAMLDYFAAAVYWEGRNQAKAITALESKPTPTQRAINATEEAYQQGMLADNPSDQYDAMEQLRTAEQKVRDFFGWDESVDVDDEIKSYFGTSDQAALLEQLKDYNEDVQDLFADYLFARTKYDGVIEGQAQRVDAGVAELTERLSSESHAARQEMVSATLPDGSACTIVGGNFELTDDGRIDTEKSDQTVIIMRDGEKKMISADQVGNVTTMPIEQVINEQVTAYRQQADTEFENGINLVAQSRQQAEAAEQQQAQAEQAQEQAPQAEEQTTEEAEEEQPTIPVDAKGNPLYEQATPELVVQDIYDNQGLSADIATQFVDNKLEEAKKIAEKLAKKEPKIGTNIAQYKEAMSQWQQATTEAQSNIAFWEEVKAVASQRNQPTEETAPVVEVEEQAEETTEAEQPTEEVAEEVSEEQTPMAEDTQSVAETQAETTEEQSAEEETAPEAEQTTEEEVAEETPTKEQPSAETAEEQPQAEQTEEVTEEYIGQVVNSLAEAYDSFVNEAQKEVTNNLDNFKAEVASRTDEEIATAIADIESTPDLVELFERVRNGLLSGEIKRTEQEEQDLINALQRIAQGNVAKNTLLPIFIAEQQKRAEQQTESKTESQPKAKAKPKATSKAKATPKTTAKAKTPKRKKEVNFFKYILPKKERELRPVLAGVFMRDGYRVASDTHILIAERAEYSPALEGRVINEDGIALVDKEGNPIINNIAWQKVIPTPENSSLVLTPIESIMAMLEQAKPLNKIFADDAPYNGNTATEIEIETENGPAFFDSAKLALFMDFVLTIDNPTLAYGNKTRSIWVTSADGSKKAVLMGLASESDRVEAIRISTRKGIEVGADFSYNNKKTNGLKSELKESEDYIALMKAQPVPPRRELSFHEKKVAQLKALIAIREGKTDLADAAEDARRKPLRQRAKEWEQKTGTKVVIVEDETEIEQESARRQVAESKVMGWYNRKSGEVYLYMPNLMSEEDIDNTFIHEVVIHKGLRGLLKPQAYNSVMQRVFDSLSPEQQAKWLNYPGVKGDAIKAADEYIANTFESIEVENPSLWQKFVDAIRTALINMGINLKVSDATLGSLIRQSYRKMAEQKAMEIPTEMIEAANEIPADASAETSFSIKIAHTLNEKSMEYAKQKGVSEEFMDALRKAEADINQMAERISQDLGGDLDAKRRGKRMLPEEVNVQDGKPLKGYSTIFKNGSYGRTMENTLKCLRTLAYIDFVNDVKERIGRPLTSQESFLASQMLYDISVDPQCLYCYVSLDRKAYDEFLIRYLNQRDAVIAAYDSLSAKDKKNPKVIDELYQDFLASRKDTKEMKRRFNMWIDARKAGLPLLNAADVATTTRRDNIRNNGDASLNAQLKDAEAYAQGASWAKKEDEYRAYTGEILRLPQSTVNTLNKEYGLRFYSFSEYSPAFIVENMQMIRDAAIRGLRGLAYTKETDFVKIFAPSQININVSVFGRRDANGNMVADTRQGADWAEAKALREQYPNVGAVFVATNDADVEWALAQDWIDVVIPFHIVRTGADIANFYEWVNYSSEQADKDAKGRKADISPVEHLNSKERYMQLVEERNLTPRFAKWSDNPNYMKLVNETRRPYNQTPTLTPSFMLNEALTSWSEFNEKGGYYGGWYNVDEQGYQDAVAQVTEDIQEGRTAKDVDYGRQDVPADAWNTKRQTREQRVHHNAPLTNASEITQEESANDEDIAFSVADDAVNTADTFTSAAEAIAQQLGVEIEIDESIPAKGSYNPRTGRIRINPSRHATAEDVQRTVLHETIGHGGIQAVAGKRFGQVCQQVYDMMSEEQRADIRSRHGNLSDEAVGAEYIAEMAEKGKVDITTWEKVKAMVRNMLMSMGINLNLTDADIRYMLYSAHQLAEKGKLQDAINRATTLGKLRRQAELSHDVAEDAMSRPLMRPIDPDLIELTTGELGLTDVQVIDADTLEKMFDSTKLAKANKHSIFTQFKNNFVDRTRPIAKFIQQVYGLKNIGEAYVWNPEENPHIGANLAPSKAMRRTQVFRQGKMKDLLDTYNNLWMEWRKVNRGYGVEYAQAMARLYAIAKTAQERQTIKGKGSKDTDFAGVAGVLKWIGMTVKVHNGKFLKPINWETEAAALGKDHDELTIAECEAILAQHGYPSMQEFIAEFEKGVDVKEFWNMTQAISHDMLRNQLEAGLLSPTSYQILMYGKSFVEIAKAKGVTDTNMLMSMVTMTDSQRLVDLGIITQDEADALTPYYQHYLPLKDSTDIEQTDVVDYGGNRKVEGSKRAVQSVTGHSNMVGDPIARLCYDYTVAIHNEEENKWKLQLLDIVRYHQSTTPPKKRMAVATSRKYINGLIGAFDEVRINPHAMSEHEVAVFENGSQVVIRFADKSIAEAVNPEKVKVGKFLQTLNKFNRFLANAYTSKNPAFVVPNVIRDYQAGFQYNLAKGKEQWKIYHKMMANARSRQALYDLLINREDHSAWGNTKYADYVQEFLDNGGPTAVNQMASLDNIQDELNKTAKAINEAKTPLSGLKKGARATTEWLGRMGEMAELTTRLATYIAARECGKSVSLAALEAKEVSVNFDRKGKASIRKYFPLFSIFQNAALQSLRREMGLMREAPWTYTAYRLIKPAMHIGLSIYVGMLINGIDGDDEEAVKEYLLNYFSVNSHTASANFLIPTPWGTSFSIPAAIDDMGFNKLAFLITKRVMLNSITGHAYNAEESVMDDVIEVVSQFADMAGQNPLTVGLSTLTPSFDDMEVGERVVYAWSANPVFSPFIQTGLNRDYKGEKFYGEPLVDQGRPRNYYDWNKNSFGHSVAKLLNDATGGNDAVPGFINIQGTAIDLFFSSYLGGYGDFASKTLDTGKNAGELLFGDGKIEEYGKEKEIGLADVISDLPVAYRFAKAPIEVYGEIGVKDHVVRLKNKANEWERQIVNQYKDGYIEDAQEMLQDGNGSGSAQDYYLSIGRSKIYEWSKDIPNAKTLYEDMMSETYHNGEYSTLGQAAIIIGQAEMFSSLIKGNFDDLENPNDASYLYEDIKKYYLPTMKEILKEAEPEEANAEIEAIAQEIVDYYNELGNPTPHTKDTKLYKEDE